jgi:RNA 3'-phosphate cyclase
MISIDGSYQEGGGQILRTALALSTILNREIEIFNIRKKRKNPGLAEQHLRVIEVYKKIFGAKCEGDYLGSQKIRFFPSQEIKSSYIQIIPQTSSSIGLILQAVLPSLYFLDKKINLEIGGGTVGKWAPPFEFYPYLIFPLLNIEAEIEIKRTGYYPKGGGLVLINFKNFSPKRIELIEKGDLEKIKIISFSSLSLKERKVAERQLDSALRTLERRFKKEIETKIEYVDTLSSGCHLIIYAKFYKGIILWADALGEKGKTAESVGKEAGEKFLKEIDSGSCCDIHLVDNLIPYLAFLGGKIKTSQISLHTLTNIWVCERILEKKIFKIEENVIEVKS